MSPKTLKFNSPLEEISFIHCQLKFGHSTDRKNDKEKLESKLSRFYDNHCKVYAEIPGNEQLPYTKEEIGFDCVPMPHKSKKEAAQTGDYAFLISIMGEPTKRLKIRFERKSVPDFNGTILGGWDTFMSELDRADQNPEIEDFRVVVEGSRLQTLAFFMPLPAICKYCELSKYKIKNKKRIYFCGEREVKATSSCSRCKPHKRSPGEIAQQINYKRKLIGKIEARRVPVEFCDNRREAAIYINVSVKEYFIYNYAEIIDI